MDKKMMKGLSGVGVFLAAVWAKPVFYNVITIQAGLVFS